MIAALMLVFTVGALVQFFIAYCRTLLLAYGKVELTERIRQVAGINVIPLEPLEFQRLIGLLRVAPDPGDDAAEIRAVSLYYQAVRLFSRVASRISKAARHWAEGELTRCTYFAAIALDRRLAPTSN